MSGNVVVLTGAGISAESGLRTFRASDGLWEEHRIEDVATPQGFARDPALVHRFYNERRRTVVAAAPNAAHVALADFERQWQGDFLLVTQNIDDLHERAGSSNLVHMHGELLRMFCRHCNMRADITDDLSVETACASCGARGGMRPDIVWFGEMPYQMERIERALLDCALFLSVGTSGNVYPAAGFVQTARIAGAKCVEINLEKSATNEMFSDAKYGKATEMLPAYLAEILANFAA